MNLSDLEKFRIENNESRTVDKRHESMHVSLTGDQALVPSPKAVNTPLPVEQIAHC